jgi:hypothetical protein
MKYGVTKTIPKDTVAEMQKILGIRKGHWKYAGRDDVIRTFTVRFPDRYEADIKVCNGDTPYVDAVLFDPNGCEAQSIKLVYCVLEVSDTLLGEYPFHHGGNEYVANLKDE